MKLMRIRNKTPNEFWCELSMELDNLCGIHSYQTRFSRHYVYVDKVYLKENILVIRVPGRSMGGIYLDDSNKIIDIKIDRESNLILYPENIEELLKDKFLGVEVELNEIG